MNSDAGSGLVDPPVPTALELFRRASDEQRGGDNEQLLRTALEIIRLYARKAAGFALAAQTLVKLNRHDEAMQIIDQGLKLHPDEEKLHSVKLNLYIAKEDSDGVAQYADRLLAPDSDHVSAIMLADLAAYEMGRSNFGRAEVAARRLVESGNGTVSSYLGLVQALVNLNRADEAVEIIDRAIDAFPSEPKLYRAAEAIQVQLGDTANALEYARKWVSFDRSNEKAQYAVFLALVSLGRFDEAEEQLEIAHRQSATFDVWKTSHNFRQIERLRATVPAVVQVWETGLKNRSHSPNVPRSQQPIPVIQYWSQGQPPKDVGVVVETWNSILRPHGLGPTLVYDSASAKSWIDEYAPEFAKAFAGAFHFAMESDIFRIAYASRLDCIYLDIDSWPLTGIADVLSSGLQSGSSMLYFRAAQPTLNNSFFIARRNCPFFSELIRQCSTLDPSGMPPDRNTILMTFGPGRFNSVLYEIMTDQQVETINPSDRANGVSHARFKDGRTLAFANEFATAAQKPPYALDYKSTGDYWKAVPQSR